MRALWTILSVVLVVVVAGAIMDVGYWFFFLLPLLLFAIVPGLYLLSLRRLRRINRSKEL